MIRTAAAGVLLLASLTACPASLDDTGDAGTDCPYETPVCDRNTLRWCDDAGVEQSEACGERRCASDAPEPFCVDPNQPPCDPETQVPTCVNGLLRGCDAERLYPADEDCGQGRLCFEGDDGARCDDLGAHRCDEDTFSPLCVDGRHITCEGDRLRERPGC